MSEMDKKREQRLKLIRQLREDEQGSKFGQTVQLAKRVAQKIKNRDNQ